jgi:hypothetical protein
LDLICDVVDMFAEDNKLSRSIIHDDLKLKNINYYSRYDSREELEIAHNNNTDINFNLYSNNLEFILIEDKYGYMDLEDQYPEGNRLMDKMVSLVSRIRKICPNLKIEWTKGPMKFNIKITKDK